MPSIKSAGKMADEMAGKMTDEMTDRMADEMANKKTNNGRFTAFIGLVLTSKYKVFTLQLTFLLCLSLRPLLFPWR